jgi:ACS family hexuronate transporter-like MFS transporter
MTASAPAPTLAPKSGNYRWRICAILFIATTINYVDRNVLSFTMRDDGFRRVMLDLPAGAPLGAAEIALFKEQMGDGDAAFKFA